MYTTIPRSLRCTGDLGVAGGVSKIQQNLVSRDAPELLPQVTVSRQKRSPEDRDSLHPTLQAQSGSGRTPLPSPPFTDLNQVPFP